MSQENKDIARRHFEEICTKGDLSVADEIHAPDFIAHGVSRGVSSEPLRGAEGPKRAQRMFRAAFPDFHVTVEDVFGEEDKVAVRVTARGTHKGEFMGIAATGKLVTGTAIVIYRITGGQIQEAWVDRGDLGMSEQLRRIAQPVESSR